jgi:hypothetical protein
MIDLTLLASHQSLLLGGMGVLLSLNAAVYVWQHRLPKGPAPYWRVIHAVAWLLGAYSTYAAVYLGWYRLADPFTISLLFLAGAVGMHLFKHVPWAWLLAPLLAGYGILELWQAISASPSWQVSLGSMAALTLPVFLILTYIERAHQSLGEILTVTRLAVVVAALLIIQAVALWAGVSLWGIAEAGVLNALTKITTFLGGL